MPVVVTATDARGVEIVDVAISEWSWSVAAEPFEATGLAPVVATPTTISVDVTVTDIFGNSSSASPSIQVAPRENANTPVIAVACVRELGFVVPGVTSEIRLQTSDDEAVESIRFLVDEQEIERVTPVNELDAEYSFYWTPSADSSAGTSFVLRLESRDFAGNVASHEMNVTVPTGPILRGGGSLFDDYQGQEVTLADGEFVAREPLHVGTLRIARGASLATLGPPDEEGTLEVVADVLDLACGSALDQSGLGFDGGTAPPWVMASQSLAGGSHGGFGRAGQPGEIYDSVFEPRVAGGGGAGEGGGSGGGVVRLDVGELVVDGDIVARGIGDVVGAFEDSAGAGGTILIDVGTLRGVGRIDASGGDQYRCFVVSEGKGSGGGGRIALRVATLDGFDPETQARAWGGTQFQCSSPDGYGGAGTVLLKLGDDVHGRLFIDNGKEDDGSPRSGPSTELPSLGIGAVTAITPSGTDAWVESAEPFLPRWVGASMVLLDASGQELGSFTVLELNAAGSILLQGAATALGAATYRGEYHFDQIHLLGATRLSTTDPVVGTDLSLDGDIEVPEILTADTVLVKAGSRITPITGGNLSLRVAGTLTVEAGARLEVNGNGYLPGEAPAWVIAAAERYSAGAHGGVETNSAVSAEERVFGSVYVPQMPGGGGALLGGGMGGGVLAIDAATVVLDGEIEANGVSNGGDGGPPGAGGSVFIRAETLLGSGSIDASGGDGIDSCYWLFAPASGGGRVGLDVASLSGFDPLTQITAHGGTVRNCEDDPLRYASPGTVLVRTSELPLGELIVDNGTEEDGTPRLNSKMTFLPPLGSGAIVSFDATGSDAWITGSEPFRPRWVGAWVVLSDSSGADLGLFEVLEVDASGRALAGGAGAVGPPASYRGKYRFDRISLRNDSGVWADDPMTTGDQVFDADASIQGTLEAETLIIQSGVTVEARGPQFRLQIAGQLTIESGATLQADEQGYVNGGAPIGVAGSLDTSGGSHGGTGSHSTANGSAGEVYDSVYRPVLPGGGGAPGSRDQGSAGGGAIEIVADQVVLDGEIRALSRNSTGDFDHAGAGGTVSIETGILSGAGSIDVSGGRGSHSIYSYVGAGGGGRVALLADSVVGFDPATQVHAGGGSHKGQSTNVFASPGTIFVKELSDTYGRLIVDADVPDTVGSPSVLPTLLPTIGRGSIGSISVDSQDPADLWVEDQDPGRLFSLGVDRDVDADRGRGLSGDRSVRRPAHAPARRRGRDRRHGGRL